jgi:hypothetical protein
MLPAKQQKMFLTNAEKTKNKRGELMKVPEVQQTLGPKEALIIESSLGEPISIYPYDVLTKYVATLTFGICADLGIVITPDQKPFVATRLMNVIKTYYSDLTLKEVKLAFELLHVGVLDAFLPLKDNKGNAERGHYNKFSVEFINRVLMAYQKKRASIVIKMHKALPQNNGLTDDQKKANRQYFIDRIIQAFYNYKEHKIKPKFTAEHLIINEFIDAGILVGEYVEPHGQAMPIDTARHNATVTPGQILAAKKRNSAYLNLILQVFDAYIEKEIKIEDRIKLTYD